MERDKENKGHSEECPFAMWLQEQINHAQKEILDLVELAYLGKLEREVVFKLTSRIKRELQDLARSATQELNYYEIKALRRIRYGE
jgi:hypothetical protein